MLQYEPHFSAIPDVFLSLQPSQYTTKTFNNVKGKFRALHIQSSACMVSVLQLDTGKVCVLSVCIS